MAATASASRDSKVERVPERPSIQDESRAPFRIRPIMKQGTPSSIQATWTRFATIEDARKAVAAMYHDDRVMRAYIVRDERPPRFVEWVER